ncbi:MAG: tetratricopeptide repeat protein, partial [Acidobacteriota bacterium]
HAAAAQPPPSADLIEATRWYTGVAGRVDDGKAKELLERAAASGDPLARMWVARCLSRGRMGFAQDAGRARAMAAALVGDVQSLAIQGVLEAVFLMGTANDEALGVAENPVAAAGWFRRAAERGHVLAQHNLGNAYASGRGVEKDDEAAVEWWLKAARQGDTIPQLRLGEAYEQGRGVVRDLAEARRWYAEAAGRGNAAAHAALERLKPVR